MRSEMDSMYSNQVWNLVHPPEGIKPIKCKWVFKRKTGVDGKVETYKARLVAKGFRQKQGVDYDETFSPVAMLKSIRILFVTPQPLQGIILYARIFFCFFYHTKFSTYFLKMTLPIYFKGNEILIIRESRIRTLINLTNITSTSSYNHNITTTKMG